MAQPPSPPAFAPELVLLLQGDPADAVTRALGYGRARLPWPLVVVSAAQVLDSVTLGEDWMVAGQRVLPQRTALINRLPMADRLEPDGPAAASAPARQALWARLRRELGRFAYVSSLPTATSLMGCHGSLLDQWQDLPRLLPGLRVPDHAAPAVPRALEGPVFTVNRWTPYSLGKPRGEAPANALPAAVRLDYVMPAGRLVHVAQVGRSLFFPHPPPWMTAQQQQSVVHLVLALAAVSPLRIAEHALFVGDCAPVLYSSCPVPVLSGAHALYPDLVQQGLAHDIPHWRARPVA